uniref:Dixin n=1 Tax=Oncorhynchus kisutch TaxID=8019 RepID=A0A8C7I2K6_ONCKI
TVKCIDRALDQQLSTYVLWVNSQLKRRPGLKPIIDLRLRVDLQDGVVLSHLVEIVAGEALEGVHQAPRDREESRENVERVLNFITSRRIRMPHTSARDIVEGDLKSVMRLILALAAHFKPSANQRAASRGGRSMAGAAANHRTLSTVAMAQSAATALAAARHDAEGTKELGQKDRLLQQHKHKLEESQLQKAGLQRELECKDNMLQEMMSRHGDQAPPHLTELQLVRSALRSLRGVFREQDPQHHTLDTLEQGITSLTDRLTHTHQGKGKSSGCNRATHNQHDSWPPSKMAHSYSSPLLSSCGSTKVLYFTDHSHTPCMIHINKRLGKVTLRDVKTAVDRDDNYRFHFKALDPEFGTVKEEVFEDEALVPGWEGKIVAWVEENNGEERYALKHIRTHFSVSVQSVIVLYFSTGLKDLAAEELEDLAAEELKGTSC